MLEACRMDNDAYSTIRSTVLKQMENGQYKPALALLKDMLKSAPLSPALQEDMSYCYWQLGDADTAIKLAQIVAQDHATDGDAWSKLGAIQLSAGDTQGAESSFRTALKFAPQDARTLAVLNRIKPFKKGAIREKTLRKISRSNAPAPERAMALNALGRIETRAGNSRAALAHFLKAKALTEPPFDPAPLTARVNMQCRDYPRQCTPARPQSAHRPVFVVGLPRSGTTLVETILTAHSAVGSAGESHALSQCRARAEAQASPPWDIPDDLAQSLATLYLAHCEAGLSGGLPSVLIDKTPLNLFDLGFALRLFPEARFIFLSRHPLDTGLSNISTGFHAAHPFSRSLEDIGQMIRLAYRAAHDYEDKLGAAFRWQSYEALVKKPEEQIRALLAHVGLPFEPACLTPEKQTNIIRTASLTQVRAPINTGALGKWTPFEQELAPLIEALGGWEWIKIWEAYDRH